VRDSVFARQRARSVMRGWLSLCRLAAAALEMKGIISAQLSGDEDEDDYAFKVSLNPKPGTPAIEKERGDA
jgi:hypothetical protein